MMKRRAMNVVPSIEPSASSNSTPDVTLSSKKIYTAADVPSLAATLKQASPSTEIILEAITGFRKMLSVERNPPVQEVMEAGMLPIFVQLLSHPDAKIQFEAAWALTNVASTEHTRAVVESGAVSKLVELLMSGNADVREQSAWCIGNIAGEGADLRDMVLQAGAMNSMLINIQNPASDSLLANVTWALSNLCRGKPQPDLEVIAPAIPLLCQVVASGKKDAMQDALWALSYLSDGNDTRIEAVVRTGIAPTLVQILSGNDTALITPALRTLGNFVSGTESQTQAVLDADVLKVVVPLLNHQKKNIRKETCWLLSNIAAGSMSQINQLGYKRDILTDVISLMQNAEWEVKKEATWVISNIATGGNENNVHQLVEFGAIDALCSMINSADPKILMVVLDAIDCILKHGKNANRDYAGMVDECDGLDALEELQEHEYEQVYEKSVSIIETYFGVEEGEDENLVPEVDGNMFSFGANVEKIDEHASDFYGTQQPLQRFNF